MISFIPSKKNMARRPDGNIFGFHSQDTKGWYLDTYFEGKDTIVERLLNGKQFNPVTNGDDYSLTFIVRNPDEFFGMNYKKIKYFVSNIVFSNTDEFKTYQDVSFWFVENTKTRWVDGIANVIFTLSCDIFTTFTNILENMSGNFYFKRKHFDRWKQNTLPDIDNEISTFAGYVPNFKEAPFLVNCNSFCENKNKKFMQETNISPSEKKDLTAVIYYTVGLSASVDDTKGIARSTNINFNNNTINIPYGILFVDRPFRDSYTSDNLAYSYLENGIALLQKEDCIIQNVSFIDIKWTTELKEKYAPILTTISGYYQPHRYVKETFSTGGYVYIIDDDIIKYSEFYLDNDNIYSKSTDDLLTDEIKVENEVHLTVANHQEIHLSVPEKNALILDSFFMFQNGVEMYYDNTNKKLGFKIDWNIIFDVENGGLLGYLYNSGVNKNAAYFTNRTFIDFTGQYTIPYKTDEYLEQMITRKNQKQASYDNIDTQKQTATTNSNIQFGKDMANTAATAAKDVASNASWNPFKSARGVAEAGIDLVNGTIQSTASMVQRNNTINSQYKQAKNTLDASYADLANSPSNVHTTEKVNGISILWKALETENYNMFPLKWFKNEIIEIERKQIAYDMNKYGYTCDYLQQISNFKNEIRTRRLWDYMEIINIKECLQNVEIDPAVVEFFDGIFSSGVFIFNLDNWKEPLNVNFDKHNYELSLLSDFTLDNTLDYIML